jgi:hypothetical protein
MKKSFIVLILGISILNWNTSLDALSFKNQKKEVKAPLENIDNTMALSDVFAVGEGRAEYFSHYNTEHIEEKIKNLHSVNAEEKLTFLSAFRFVSSLPKDDSKEKLEHEKLAKATLALFAFGNEKTLSQLAKKLHKDTRWGNRHWDKIVKNFLDSRPLSPTTFLSAPGVALLNEIKTSLPEYQKVSDKEINQNPA